MTSCAVILTIANDPLSLSTTKTPHYPGFQPNKPRTLLLSKNDLPKYSGTSNISEQIYKNSRWHWHYSYFFYDSRTTHADSKQWLAKSFLSLCCVCMLPIVPVGVVYFPGMGWWLFKETWAVRARKWKFLSRKSLPIVGEAHLPKMMLLGWN